MDDILWGSVDSGSAGSWVQLSGVNGAGGFLSGTGTQLTQLDWTGVTLLATLGSHSLKLKITDKAGNENPGLVFSQGYVVDTSAPSTTANSISLGTDTGSSTTDYLTRQQVQTLQGTLGSALLAGESVYVSTNNGLTWLLASTTPNTFRVENASLDSGNKILLVKVFDVAATAARRLPRPIR